jgi:hypothetical protein
MVDVQVSQQNLLERRNIETASSDAFELPPPASTRSRGFPSIESTYPAETRLGLAIGPPLPSTVSDNLEFKRRNR